MINKFESRNQDDYTEDDRLVNASARDEDTELEKESSSFYLRLVISILCFICFVFMEQNKTEVAEVNSDVIVNEIEKDIDINTVTESWKSQ